MLAGSNQLAEERAKVSVVRNREGVRKLTLGGQFEQELKVAFEVPRAEPKMVRPRLAATR